MNDYRSESNRKYSIPVGVIPCEPTNLHRRSTDDLRRNRDAEMNDIAVIQEIRDAMDRKLHGMHDPCAMGCQWCRMDEFTVELKHANEFDSLPTFIPNFAHEYRSYQAGLHEYASATSIARCRVQELPIQ